MTTQQIKVSLEWCIEGLEQLQKCNLDPASCTHDTDEQGHKQPFDQASIDMHLDTIISELKRTKEATA